MRNIVSDLLPKWCGQIETFNLNGFDGYVYLSVYTLDGKFMQCSIERIHNPGLVAQWWRV
jgi:hypothetical protein